MPVMRKIQIQVCICISKEYLSNMLFLPSGKKKEKQKILKKLQEVEKLINQRSTKTSS
jgi:hypothetical protein